MKLDTAAVFSCLASFLLVQQASAALDIDLTSTGTSSSSSFLSSTKQRL